MPQVDDDDHDGVALPPERAFVLQFRHAAGEDPASFVGRIEHVLSGERARFGSIDAVVTFVARVLGRLTAGSQEGER